MPQMAPMNWLLLNFYFIAILMLHIMYINFNMSIMLPKTYKCVSKFKFNLKW